MTMTTYALAYVYQPETSIGEAAYNLLCMQQSDRYYYANPLSQAYLDLLDEIDLEEAMIDNFRPIEGYNIDFPTYDDIELPF